MQDGEVLIDELVNVSLRLSVSVLQIRHRMQYPYGSLISAREVYYLWHPKKLLAKEDFSRSTCLIMTEQHFRVPRSRSLQASSFGIHNDLSAAEVLLPVLENVISKAQRRKNASRWPEVFQARTYWRATFFFFRHDQSQVRTVNKFSF